MHIGATIPESRARSLLLFLAIATVALGLSTRRFPAAFPTPIARYGGDALYAVMVYWLLAFLRPRASSLTLAAGALTISIAVECSQLLTWGWLLWLRGTRLGALGLGQGFLWTDLFSYAAGVVLALGADLTIRRVRGHRRRAEEPARHIPDSSRREKGNVGGDTQ